MLESIKEDYIRSNKKSWDEVAPRFFGRTALPVYGPFLPTENELSLFDDVEDKKVLELGCGSGHSLNFMASRGASELWGIDLSDTQIETAWDLPAMMNQLKLNTYINELIQSGFQIEKVIEDAVITEEIKSGDSALWYSHQKAALIPAAFIIKCTKKYG